MNAKPLFLCAVLTFCATPTPLQAGTWALITLPSGLVAWWPANGTAADASTNHLDGALSGGAVYSNGWAGSAFAFDGVNGCATVPDSPALRLTNTLTIEFWARRQRFAIDSVLGKGGDWNTAVGGEANYGVGLHTIHNRMFYFFRRGG